jgi:hypothetical protein
MLAVCAIVCATLAYRSHLSVIRHGTLRDMPKLVKQMSSLSKIWRSMFLYQWKRYSTDRSFEKADF